NGVSAVPYRRTFARLLSFLRPYKRGLVISAVLAVGSQAAQIALIWVTGKNVIDDALLNHDTQKLWLYVGIIAALGVVSAVLMSGRGVIFGKQGREVWVRYRRCLYSPVWSPSDVFVDSYK